MIYAHHIELHQRLIESLWRTTRGAYPREACALLFGIFTSTRAVVRKVRTVENLNKGLNGFTIERNEMIQAQRETHHQLLGLFHSHRHNAEPSAADLQSMKKQSMIWIIACSGHPPSGSAFRMKAYVRHKGIISELKIKEVNQ